jgi:hypothetical protein
MVIRNQSSQECKLVKGCQSSQSNAYTGVPEEGAAKFAETRCYHPPAYATTAPSSVFVCIYTDAEAQQRQTCRLFDNRIRNDTPISSPISLMH